jgi:hypothetical protein
MANQTTPFEVDLTGGGAAVTGHTTGRNANGVGYGIHGITDVVGSAAVVGESNAGLGVHGISTSNAGVAGQSSTGNGVSGSSTSAVGLYGTSGTVGSENSSTAGVLGLCEPTQALGLLGGVDRVFKQHAGVYGESDQQGVFGNSTNARGTGVYGIAGQGAGFGVRGDSKEGIAVQGQSFGTGDGVHGVSVSGTGIYGKGGQAAAVFDGYVQINGDQQCQGTLTVDKDIVLPAADCAEEFDVAAGYHASPGMVMVLSDDGSVRPSTKAYDTRVIGVVSGAGAYRPGLILDKRRTAEVRVPVGILGKVYVMTDAQYSSVRTGDLLTSSDTPGHAMRAEPAMAFGTVIGKALAPLEEGCGLLPVLITLR